MGAIILVGNLLAKLLVDELQVERADSRYVAPGIEDPHFRHKCVVDNVSERDGRVDQTVESGHAKIAAAGKRCRKSLQKFEMMNLGRLLRRLERSAL